MNLAVMVEEALSDRNESELLKKKSDDLSRTIRGAVLSRAHEITEAKAKSFPLANNQVEQVVADWVDKKGLRHQIILRKYFGELISRTYTPNRPSGRLTSSHSLLHTPLQHLSEHFGPLMS